GLLATHPPLVERIRRLDPQFDGQFPEVRPGGVDREELEGPAPAASPRSPGGPDYLGWRRCRRRSCGLPAKRRPAAAMSRRKKLATPRRCRTACLTCSGSPPRSRSVLAP